LVQADQHLDRESGGADPAAVAQAQESVAIPAAEPHLDVRVSRDDRDLVSCSLAQADRSAMRAVPPGRRKLIETAPVTSGSRGNSSPMSSPPASSRCSARHSAGSSGERGRYADGLITVAVTAGVCGAAWHTGCGAGSPLVRRPLPMRSRPGLELGEPGTAAV